MCNALLKPQRQSFWSGHCAYGFGRFSRLTMRLRSPCLQYRISVDKTELPKHRADAAHLPHQPLNRHVAAYGILGYELPSLLRQIDQDRTRFKHASGWPPGPFGSISAGFLLFGLSDRNSGEVWSLLPKVHEMRLVRQADFFQNDRRLHAVGRRQRIKLDSVRVLGRPFLRDGKWESLVMREWSGQTAGNGLSAEVSLTSR